MGNALFVVPQYETVGSITRFGKIVPLSPRPVEVKLPVIDSCSGSQTHPSPGTGPPIECPPKISSTIIVDCFARWRISDPMLYYNRLNDQRSALSRLDDILAANPHAVRHT